MPVCISQERRMQIGYDKVAIFNQSLYLRNDAR